MPYQKSFLRRTKGRFYDAAVVPKVVFATRRPRQFRPKTVPKVVGIPYQRSFLPYRRSFLCRTRSRFWPLFHRTRSRFSIVAQRSIQNPLSYQRSFLRWRKFADFFVIMLDLPFRKTQFALVKTTFGTVSPFLRRFRPSASPGFPHFQRRRRGFWGLKWVFHRTRSRFWPYRMSFLAVPKVV